MKTKYTMLLALAIAGATHANAQNDFRMGFRFGMGPSTYRFQPEVSPAARKITGIDAGLYFRIPIVREWGVALATGYGLSGYKTVTEAVDVPPVRDEHGNIEIPGVYVEGDENKNSFHAIFFDAHAYYRLPIWRNFAVSPTAGWFVNTRLHDNSKTGPYHNLKSVDTGPSLGVCVDISRTFQIGFDRRVGIVELYKPEFSGGLKPQSSSTNWYVRFLFGRRGN
jgi:hypothetical protein